MNDLGNRVKKLRTGRGLSIRNLAGKVGYAPSTISRIEKGESSPDVKTTYALSQFFNVPHDYILYGVEPLKVSKNAYNVLSKSPVYFSSKYLEMIDAIDLLTKGELQQALGIIKYVVSQTGDSLEDRKTRKEKSDISWPLKKSTKSLL